jgi:hypothetical protein
VAARPATLVIEGTWRWYDEGFGIAVDGAGNAYVTGLTQSIDFPTTPGAFPTTRGRPGGRL